eukprot:3818114-Prymnesium_polylepis.1
MDWLVCTSVPKVQISQHSFKSSVNTLPSSAPSPRGPCRASVRPRPPRPPSRPCPAAPAARPETREAQGVRFNVNTEIPG